MGKNAASTTGSITNSIEKKYYGRNGLKNSPNDKEVSYTQSERELTPGSLQIWLDLPEEIKHDPHLAPFKRFYEETHGKLESSEIMDDSNETFHNTTEDKTEKYEDTRLENIDGALRLIEPLHAADDRKLKSNGKVQFKRVLRVVKLCVLVACWVLLTISLLLNRERADTILHTAVNAGEVKEYPLPINQGRVRVLFTLTGPFSQPGGNDSDIQLELWLHRTFATETGEFIQQNSSKGIVHVQPEGNLDFAPSVTESRTLTLDVNKIPSIYKRNANHTKPVDNFSQWNQNKNDSRTVLRMRTTSNVTVPLTITYHLDPLDDGDGIIYSLILLLTLYILIIFEIVNRTIAALLSSSLAVGVLALSGSRPSLPELVSWLDVETLLLLFSMMILVAILAETGLFDRLAVLAFEMTGGKTWPLINCLCVFTALFSTFLDNVTTVLLMTPVTIRLCEVMQLNPVPVLMSMVIFSNVGGAATPVGDPPNVIIATQPFVLRENINFTTFTLHMGVGILLVCVQTYIQLRYMFRDINTLRHSVPNGIQEMRQEIAVWRRAASSLASYSKDEDVVRRALEKKVDKLNTTLARREAGGGSKTDPIFCSTLAQMKQKYRIRDMQLLIKSATSVLFVVVVFFLHAIPELQRLSLGWTALLGALLLLLLAERDDLEPILARVEWSTLLFFAALFVLMEALSKLGLISWIGKVTESVILQVNEEWRLAVSIMLILWVSGLASAFVDNIPLTTMMVRVIAALGQPDGLGLPLAPLTWALSFGACLGGNGTLIGASANVVCAGVAEQHGYRFTFMQYLKIGFPIMLGNLVVASIYLLICHCVCQWH